MLWLSSASWPWIAKVAPAATFVVVPEPRSTKLFCPAATAPAIVSAPLIFKSWPSSPMSTFAPAAIVYCASFAVFDSNSKSPPLPVRLPEIVPPPSRLRLEPLFPVYVMLPLLLNADATVKAAKPTFRFP